MALRVEGMSEVPVGRLVRYHGSHRARHGVYRIAGGCDCARCHAIWDKAWEAAYLAASPARRRDPQLFYIAHDWRYLLADPDRPDRIVLRCVGQDSVTAID